MIYEGRSTFSNPPTRQELEEFAQAIVRNFAKVAERRTWVYLDVVRSGFVAAALDCALPVDTSDGSTVGVQLPAADVRFGGRELAINRLSASGVITVMPPVNATVNGSATAITLPTTVGYYVFQFDSVNYLGLAN